ncbi:hypothetical protein [Kitasatospora fiedleri]|nr:hypothetical protein [Kitasatospora fiedleri]
MPALLLACTAAAAFAGAYRLADHPARQALRTAGTAALCTTLLVLILTWS